MLDVFRLWGRGLVAVVAVSDCLNEYMLLSTIVPRKNGIRTLTLVAPLTDFSNELAMTAESLAGRCQAGGLVLANWALGLSESQIDWSLSTATGR